MEERISQYTLININNRGELLKWIVFYYVESNIIHVQVHMYLQTCTCTLTLYRTFARHF